MPSLSDRSNSKAPKMRRPRALSWFEIWNRKLHFYLGLYFLLFTWLFAFSGLLLNHQWEFTSFWPERKESSAVRPIEPPPPGSNQEQVQDLMRQLGISGEPGNPTARPGRLDFSVGRPGTGMSVQADLVKREATVRRTQVNAWGVMRTLHTFSGERRIEPGSKREWLVTKVWVFCMDALAVGLIVMVLSGVYIWYRLQERRRFGWIALGTGILTCGLFAVGLAWMNSVR